MTLIERSPLHTFRGAVIGPDEPSYDSARRVWNGRIDKHPAVIVRCAHSEDVRLALEFARQQQLSVAVRGGGYSVAGHGVCDAGLVLDLSQMKGVLIDPQRLAIRVEAGLTCGELLRATQPFDLALPVGIFSGIGLTGLTLGGGTGWLSARYGLTCDHLLAVDLVLADGTRLTASDIEHADLFWAVRGGGGNFGVVTALTFRLLPLTQVLAGTLIYPFSQARTVLRLYRAFTQAASDDVTVNAVLTTLPDGQAAILLVVCCCGTLLEGQRTLAPLRQVFPPLVDSIRPMSLLEATMFSDPFSPPGPAYDYHAESLQYLSDDALETLVEQSCLFPSTRTVLSHLHGAAMRGDPAATAFALRQEQYLLEMITHWPRGETQPQETWSRQFQDAMRPFAQQGILVNFLGEDGAERVRASYAGNYERLVQIKRRYDPTNVFHVNWNIPPA